MPRTTTVTEGSLGDRIDDCLDPGYEDVAGIAALLREVSHARFMHPGVKSLEVKKMMLEESTAWLTMVAAAVLRVQRPRTTWWSGCGR